MAPNSPILGQSTRSRISNSGSISARNVNPLVQTIRSQPVVSEADIQTLQITQQNQQSLLGLQTGLVQVRQDIAALNAGLVGVSTLLQNDIANEQRILADKQNRERRLAEANIREGKEKVVEQKINRAFTSAVTPVARRTTGLFDRIAKSLLFLFSGWLLNNYGQLIRARADGNIDLANEIQSTILNGIRNATNVLLLFKGGLGQIVSGITGLSKFAGDLLIKKPFQSVRNLLSGAAATCRRTPSVKGPKGFGFFGTALTAISSILEAKDNNMIEASLGVLSILPVGRLARVAGVIFSSEQLLDLFGKGLIDEDEKGKSIVDDFMKAVNEFLTGSNTQSQSEPNSNIQPQSTKFNTPALNNESKPGVEANTNNTSLQTETNVESTSSQSTNVEPTSSQSTNVEPTSSQPANAEPQSETERIANQTERNFLNFFERKKFGDTEPIDPEISVEPQNNILNTSSKVEPKESAEEEPPPKYVPQTNIINPDYANNRKNTDVDRSMKATLDREDALLNIALQKEGESPITADSQNLIPLKEPKTLPVKNKRPPQIIPLNTSGGTSGPASPAVSVPEKSITDVPHINTSNPENFYTLYSKQIFNVV